MIICTLQPELISQDVEGNFARINNLAEKAYNRNHFSLLLLPENFPMWGPKSGRERESDKLIEFLRSLAVNYQSTVIGGSFHNVSKSDGKYYNISYVFDSTGDIIGEYKKHKLFDREMKYEVSAGEESLIFEMGKWKIGVEICADLWYPELSRNLVGEIDILAVPAMSVVRKREFQEYGRSLWHSLVMTRSQENSFITVVADHPSLNHEPYCSGATSICDPSLSIQTSDISIIHQKNDGSEGFITMQLDKKRLEKFRKYRIGKGMLPVSNFI